MAEYELHKVERENPSDPWIWIHDNARRSQIEYRRPELRFRIIETRGKGPKVYCETQFAHEEYLRSRRFPIFTGNMLNYVNEQDFVFGGPDIKEGPITQKDARIEKVDPAASLQVNDPGYARIVKMPRASSGDKKYVVVVGAGLLFVNAWYRNLLQIERKSIPSIIDVEIAQTRWRLRAMCWQLRACEQHPQIVVVLSTVLAIVGTGFAVFGFALSLKDVDLSWLKVCLVRALALLSIGDQVPWGLLKTRLISSLAILGFLVILRGLAPLWRRARISLPS